MKKRPTRRRNPNIALSVDQIRTLLTRIATVREEAAIRLGITTGLRVSELISIRPNDIDWERGVISIWDEKKDQRREVMPPLETLASLRRYLSTLPREPRLLFPMSAKSVERMIQRASGQHLGRVISWHSVRHTYTTRSSEEGIPPAVVIRNTGDSWATLLRYYERPSDTTMRRWIESHPLT